MKNNPLENESVSQPHSKEIETVRQQCWDKELDRHPFESVFKNDLVKLSTQAS